MRGWVPSLAVLGYLAAAALGNEIELVCVSLLALRAI
jgi:hypothetical protein